MNNLKVGRRYSRFGIHYWVQGPKPAVEDWYEQLKREYHPAGYGTYIEMSEPDENGEVRVWAWHGRPCD